MNLSNYQNRAIRKGIIIAQIELKVNTPNPAFRSEFKTQKEYDEYFSEKKRIAGNGWQGKTVEQLIKEYKAS